MSVLNVTIRRICPPAAFAACVQIIASVMQAVQLDIMRLGRSQQSLTSMTERVSRQAAGTNRSIEHHSVFLRSFAGCRSTAADGDWHCAGRASDNGRCQADGPLVGTKPKPVPSCFDNIQRPVCVCAGGSRASRSGPWSTVLAWSAATAAAAAESNRNILAVRSWRAANTQALITYCVSAWPDRCHSVTSGWSVASVPPSLRPPTTTTKVGDLSTKLCCILCCRVMCRRNLL